MKLSNQQLEVIVNKVLNAWKNQKIIEFKADEKKVFQTMLDALKNDYQKELDLEKDVNKMLDDLEKAHSGEFQRYKMYPLLKQKLAKERKVVL